MYKQGGCRKGQETAVLAPCSPKPEVKNPAGSRQFQGACQEVPNAKCCRPSVPNADRPLFLRGSHGRSTQQQLKGVSQPQGGEWLLSGYLDQSTYLVRPPQTPEGGVTILLLKRAGKGWARTGPGPAVRKRVGFIA